MKTNYEKLSDLLKKLFQLDQADLDFGIYRIMNQKRDEITRFLEEELLPQVQEAFGIYKSADKAELEEELEKTIQSAKAAGFDPEESPKVKEVREGLAKYGVDTTALENEVFSDLYNFFRRYYHEGDFLSLRRYKEGIYAIPYEGEEVKLHWANHDQYYIKTSEYFRDYTFKLPSGKSVHFKLAEADTEKDNIKAQTENERRFILSQEETLEEIDGELYIRFQYVPDPEKRKQTALNELAVERILALVVKDWPELGILRPTEKNPQRTLLEEHLTDYTARNTFDYFIHKDLGGFLKRELDFYIKNEIMHLDDIENESTPRVDQYLSKIKVIRNIAHKIIDFLAQIENFQKKLWLKKKFVVETNYCVTLDRIPEDLYPEIAANDEQREEWVKLFAINEIEENLVKPGYTEPLTVDFLKANPYLMLDTSFFKEKFKDELLASFESVDEAIDGLLLHSENFQALNFLFEKYWNKVKCIYVDPPFNTKASLILYKNEYRDSSWICLMDGRLRLARHFLLPDGIIQTAIDDTEFKYLNTMMEQIFGKQNFVGNIAIMHNPRGRSDDKYLAMSHEYLILFAKNLNNLTTNNLLQSEDQVAMKYPKSDSISRYRELPLRRSGSNSRRVDRPNLFYPIYYDPYTKKLSLMRETPKHVKILPLDTSGIDRVWRWGKVKAEKSFATEFIVKESGDSFTIYVKDREKGTLKPKSLWYGARYDASSHGTMILKGMFGENVFDYPKSVYAVKDALQIGSASNSIIMDFFAGSGTTGHAIMNLNREDGGKRKYILVEMGDYFDTVLKPRIQKVVYSKDWKNGKPVSGEGITHIFKYIRLESYEDTLNNLELKRTEAQQSLLDQSDSFRESYMLSYMLDVESKGRASLLNIDQLEDPFNYKLKIATGSAGETKPVKVDLVETFNYLIGLTVNHIDHIRGFRVIQGTSLKGENVLVIWRNLKEKSNKDLDEFFRKQEYNPKDMEFGLIYVNGDNNLENLRREDETWKVRLIEEDFKRLMFDVQDV